MKILWSLCRIKRKETKTVELADFSPGRHIDSDYRIAHRYKRKKTGREIKRKYFKGK